MITSLIYGRLNKLAGADLLKIFVAVLFAAALLAGGVLLAKPENFSRAAAAAPANTVNSNSPNFAVAAYGYNQPACRNGVCLNYELLGFAEGGWNMRVDYYGQYQHDRARGSIRVNGQKFAYNIRQAGSTWTGYNLEPGDTYIFRFYSGFTGKGRVLNTLQITAPDDPTTPPICSPRPAPPEGCYYDQSDYCGGIMVCPQPPSSISIATGDSLKASEGQYFKATFVVSPETPETRGSAASYEINYSPDPTQGLRFTRTYCPPTSAACPQVISPNTITLYGTPAQAGIYSFNLTAKDSAGHSAKQNFQVEILPSVPTLPPQPFVKVLSPNSGETWAKGAAQTVLFSASDGIKEVNIYLQQYHSCRYQKPACLLPDVAPYQIADRVPGNGSTKVFVDKDISGRDIPVGQYTLKIISTGGGASGESDGPFSIVDAVPIITPPIKPQTYRYIKVETPSSNSWVAWREIEVYDADGKKITPVAVSVSGTYAQSAGPRAYDGDINTVWNAGSYSGLIILDLGANIKFGKIKLLPASFPNPVNTAHYVSGKADYEANFTGITKFGGLIYDNLWLSYGLGSNP